MGLDMYLTQRHYVKNWDHQKPEERHTITILLGYNPSNIDTSKIREVITDEMYWRKANQIHNWFVKNVQDGEDDCHKYCVEEEKLRELLDAVTKVLSNHDLAETLLPTQSGFFFGGTDYDEYYYQDLEDTKRGLTELFQRGITGTMYYQSSW